MKTSKTGLVGAGGVSRSFVARMPALLAHLGPVKSVSLPRSRRIARSLRAGVGVADYAALQDCALIWILGAEDTLDDVTAELARELPLAGKMVVLCETMRDSLRPGALRTAGARVATLNCIPASDERVFVAEGCADVRTELRKLLLREGRKLIELRPAAKTLYLAGMHASAHLLMPCIMGAVESLRAAGFSRSQAAHTVQSLGSRALRGYARAGAKAWRQADAELLYGVIQGEMETIRRVDPRLAALYTDSAQLLLQPFSLGPKPKRQEKMVVQRAS
jgi:predicted short-subunit dehydrogenase-like oxidoreductase (DUF2520 family)